MTEIFPTKIRKTKYPHSDISTTFSEKIKEHPSNYSPVTCKNYELNLRILLTIFSPNSILELLEQLENQDDTLTKIKEAPLTDATKQNIVKACPTFYKVLGEREMTEEHKAPYTKVIIANNSKYQREVTLKKAQERLPLYSDFMENVKSIYGENSKEYLLISLYDELTCRDDFSQLLVTPAYKASISTYNYIIVRSGHPVEAILNQYKTAKKYGSIRVTFSREVSNRIKRYINNHNIQYGDYLFPNSKLSGFVSGILTRCGLKGSISILRRMKVSEMYNSPDHSEDEYEELAKRMGHSSQVAASIYHRVNE
jgi:hypothetical protein